MKDQPKLMHACFTCGVINMDLQGKVEGLRIENEKLMLENKRLKRVESKVRGLQNKRELSRQIELDLENAGHHSVAKTGSAA